MKTYDYNALLSSNRFIALFSALNFSFLIAQTGWHIQTEIFESVSLESHDKQDL